jgi:S-formylglutathione hydrolase FrmB
LGAVDEAPFMRKLALAALAVALVAGGAAYEYRRVLWPDPRGATVSRFTVHSRLLHRDVDEIVIAPRGGGRGRPVVVLLHGRGGGPADFLNDQWFRELAALGPRAPDLVLVSGGDHSYFHDRDDGPWGRYVMEEAIPAGIRRVGGDPRRVAIGGISMGGFGALDLALEHPGRFCAVGGHSAALWRSAGETPAGAFDDAADFAAHDPLALARARRLPLGRARVWIDAGRDDPFFRAGRALATELRAQGQPVQFHTGAGGHERSYWWRHEPAYLAFYASALERC